MAKPTTASLSSIINTDILTIGANQTGTDSFNGTIDEAKVAVG